MAPVRHSLMDQQWCFTKEDLLATPSARDGMAAAEERELRAKGVNFIAQVCAMMHCPPHVMAAAAVFLNRFLMRRSLVNTAQARALHHYQVAATAVYIALKTEEHYRRTRELIVACCRVAQKKADLVVDEQTKDYWRWRDTIVLNEDVLLEALCFDLTLELPHYPLSDMLAVIGTTIRRALRPVPKDGKSSQQTASKG